MKYSVLNIASLIMQINNQIIHIHNVYSKFSDNYIHINQNLLIFRLSELFKKSDEYILLKDFNLHYLIWNDLQYFIRYNMINELLCIVNETDLQLLTSSDIITWEDREQSFIVNLIFSTVSLKQQVISCCVNLSLKNDSDYHLIFTQFNLDK